MLNIEEKYEQSRIKNPKHVARIPVKRWPCRFRDVLQSLESKPKIIGESSPRQSLIK